jgi:magnesium chelatase family protein
MENAAEAALSNCEKLFAAAHLNENCQHITGQQQINPTHFERLDMPDSFLPDLNEVKGQAQARRALEVAAAGRHNLLSSDHMAIKVINNQNDAF